MLGLENASSMQIVNHFANPAADTYDRKGKKLHDYRGVSWRIVEKTNQRPQDWRCGGATLAQ